MRDFRVTQAIDLDPREAKLPAWAREKLNTMRRATTEAREELHALKSGTEPGPFWIDNWGDDNRRFYLPKGARFHFGDSTVTSGPELNFQADGDWCNVYAQGGSHKVTVRPMSSNVITIRAEPNAS